MKWKTSCWSFFSSFLLSLRLITLPFFESDNLNEVLLITRYAHVWYRILQEFPRLSKFYFFLHIV